MDMTFGIRVEPLHLPVWLILNQDITRSLLRLPFASVAIVASTRARGDHLSSTISCIEGGQHSCVVVFVALGLRFCCQYPTSLPCVASAALGLGFRCCCSASPCLVVPHTCCYLAPLLNLAFFLALLSYLCLLNVDAKSYKCAFFLLNAMNKSCKFLRLTSIGKKHYLNNGA